MTLLSPKAVYDNLNRLEQVDVTKSALYRELAQEVLADPSVSLRWRQAIADRLYHANLQLALITVNSEDSY